MARKERRDNPRFLNKTAQKHNKPASETKMKILRKSTNMPSLHKEHIRGFANQTKSRSQSHPGTQPTVQKHTRRVGCNSQATPMPLPHSSPKHAQPVSVQNQEHLHQHSRKGIAKGAPNSNHCRTTMKAAPSPRPPRPFK